MELLGLPLAQVLAVLGGAGALAVLLHMLRTQRRRVVVAQLALWESVLARRQASAMFARISQWLALLLSLSILALLAFALGDPRPSLATDAALHRVVLLDTGLAMHATLEPGGEPLERLRELKRRAEPLIALASPQTPTLVLAVDAASRPLAPVSTDGALLRQRVRLLEASDLVTDSERAHRVALEYLADKRPAEIVYVGSGPPVSDALRDELSRAGVAHKRIAIGAAADNLAITALAARRYPLDRNRSQLLLAIRNDGTRPAPVEITLLGDDEPIDVLELQLPPGETTQRLYDDVPFSGARIEARLRARDTSQDVLLRDSRGYAVLPERKRQRVLCVTAGNRYLEAALLLDDYIEVDVVADPEHPSLSSYDAVIFDRVAPPSPPGVPALYLGTVPPLLLETTGEQRRPRIDRIAREHPVMRHVALADVNIASAAAVRARPGDTVIAASAQGPLLLAGMRDEQPFVALTFDVAQSDLPLRVAFPLLLINTLDWFAGEQKSLEPTFVVGEPVRASAPKGLKNTQLQTPDGARLSLPVHDGVLTFSGAQAGFYRLHEAEGAPGLARTYAVNIGTGSKTLLASAESSLDERELTQPRWPAPWALLVLGALALIALEWLAFHRRWVP